MELYDIIFIAALVVGILVAQIIANVVSYSLILRVMTGKKATKRMIKMSKRVAKKLIREEVKWLKPLDE